jgi:hypothetical protein
MDIFKTLLLDTPVSTAISGTVAVNQGGTGATTAADARVNLLPSYTGNANKVLSLNSGATDVEWTANGSGTVTSVDLTAGTGISVSGGPITSTGSITVTNTAPDQTVVLTAGTGISTSGTYPNFTITNSSPDQTVVLTSGTGITVSGTYPNFTVTNSAPSLGGDVVGPASSTDNAVVRFDLATGKLVQNSGVTISDANLLTTTSLQVNDNSTFGTSNTDTVDFVGRVASEFTPSTDNTYDLGRVGHEWRDLFIDGTANIDSLVADTADINGGTIDGATIGGASAAAGKFTTLEATGVTTVSAGTVSAPAITTTGDTNTGIFFPAADSMAFAEGGVEVFRIDSNGRLGVGQTSPATKFDLSGNYGQNIVAVAALSIDCSAGNYFTKTINANSTFTFDSVPASRSFAFALELTHTSGAITWPTSVKWPKDAAPTLTTGRTHIFIFVTDDGGTRWRGASLVDYVN